MGDQNVVYLHRAALVGWVGPSGAGAGCCDDRDVVDRLQGEQAVAGQAGWVVLVVGIVERIAFVCRDDSLVLSVAVIPA